MEVPEDFAAAMLQDAPPFWHEQTPDAQAADIELCHPAPGPNEARVTVTGAAGTRRLGLSVVTADRSGVLAASAAVISRHGMTIGMALASSWAGLGIALQRFQVSPAPGSSRVVDPAPLVADLSRTLTTAGEREASTVPGGLARLRLGPGVATGVGADGTGGDFGDGGEVAAAAVLAVSQDHAEAGDGGGELEIG